MVIYFCTVIYVLFGKEMYVSPFAMPIFNKVTRVSYSIIITCGDIKIMTQGCGEHQ